jgi:hypothetical protein
MWTSGFHTVGGFTPSMNLTWRGYNGILPPTCFLEKNISGFENLITLTNFRPCLFYLLDYGIAALQKPKSEEKK